MGDVEAAISLTQGRVIGKLRRAAATGTVGFGADQRALPTNTAALPSYWACCTWWPRVKPRYLLVIIIVGALAVAAGGLAGIVLGGQADCEVQKAEALAKFGYLVDKIHEQVSLRTLPVVTLGTFIRQTPNFPEILSYFDSVGADLLEAESAVRNLQLAPGGTVSAIYPLKGHEGAIGHNLFLDPNRRPDSFKTVAGAPGVTLSNPVVLTLQGEKGRAAFARYPVFVDGPIENRTESFGAPDAYECYEKCYGDPNKVFWGFTVALVDFDKLLESTGLTKLEDEGACFVLRTSSIGNGTDLVSNNATIYSSACVSSNLVRIPVIVPNNRWFLEIGYSQGCKTWVVPVSVAYSVAMALLLLVGLYSVYQALKNSVLIQQHHDVELSHLRERQEQVVREEVTAASDSMRWLVSSLCNIMAEKSAASSGVAHDKPPNRLTSHSTSLFKYSSVSFTFKSSNRKSFSVSSNLWNLVALKASDATSLSLVLTAIESIVRELAAEFHGIIWDGSAHTGSFVTRFSEASKAVSFALKLRRALVDVTWTEEVLALRGCGPEPMQLSFQRAKGPQLQTLITLEGDNEENYNKPLELCSELVLPRQVLMTGDAMLHMASLESLIDAGYPHITSVGSYKLHGESVLELMEINDPKWDLRLHQFPLQGLKTKLPLVYPPASNLWNMPSPPENPWTSQDNLKQSVVVVALHLAVPRKSCMDIRSSAPSDEVVRKLQDAVNAMCLLFGGYIVTPPGTWTASTTTVVAFSDADSAMSFSACFQHALLYTQWAEEELAIWGKREIAMLGKLSFAGPRVKCGISLQPASSFKADEGSIDYSDDWASNKLVQAAHGGQILMDGSVLELSTITSRVDKIRVVDMGIHCLTSESKPGELKELQLVDIARNFPPILTFKEISPGFDRSPDPNIACGFVYCQAACPGGPTVSSSPAFRNLLGTWKSLTRALMARLGGYELHNKTTAIASVFPSFEAALEFSLEMQKELMEIPVGKDLEHVPGFATSKGSKGQVLFSGLRVKVGISYGIPAMRRPIQETGKAMYVGSVVQQAAHLMVTACPGQILVDGQALINHLKVPESAFECLLDKEPELVTVTIKQSDAKESLPLVVRPLGYFKMEGLAANGQPLADIVTPEMVERKFSQPPGRIDSQSADRISPSLTAASGSSRGTKDRTLATILSDILESRLVERAPGTDDAVKITGMLGEGKQGKVYSGKWKGVNVAYKVIHLPVEMSKEGKARARAVMELAISATMAHPNVVQTYNYEIVYINTSAVKQTPDADGELLVAASTDKQDDGGMILSRAISESNFTQSGYNEARLIQELCDMNTLRSALDKGIMQLRGEALPDPGLMLMLAHDIACGLQHIHSLNIIHGDLKALNVLLCSSTRKILGDRGALPKCVAKVSDFGMSEQLATEQTHQSNVHSGTITHMAPETIIAGHLSKASDVYAFGIILYEMFSGKRPYEGCNVHQIYLQVGQQGKRPIFPHGVPIKIVELACSCWGPAENRPTFEKIVVILQNMLNSYVPAVSRNYMASGQNHSAYNGAGGVDASTDDSLGIYKALQMQGSSRSVSNSMSGQSFRA